MCLSPGHEDGTVRFWDASDVAMKLVYKLSTAPVFGTDMGPNEGAGADADEEWPPFRKVRLSREDESRSRGKRPGNWLMELVCVCSD